MTLTQKDIEQLNLNESSFVVVSRKMAEKQMAMIEEYIKLHINPKPQYLPKFVWHWMIKKVLRITLPPVDWMQKFQWIEK